MLILSRKVRETIVIDGNIRITVMQIDRSNQVRIGVEAPANVTVDREEIHDRKVAEKRALA